MTTPRDPDRLIDAFLAEGLDRLPDRAYDTVRGDIDRTRQRVVIGPWKEAHMNTFAKLAIGLAAVLVVAVVGLNLLPGRGGIGGVAPSPSPTPSATPNVTPILSPTPPSVLPPEGAIAAGTYAVVSQFDAVPFSFTVPDGWTSEGGFFITNDNTDPDGVRLLFVPVGNVYSDPCRGVIASPGIGPSVDDLVAGLMALPGTSGATTQDVQVGGHDAKLVEYTIDTDNTCSGDNFYLWRDPGNGDLWTWPPYGDLVRTWIVDVDGKRFVITADIQASVSDADEAEIQDVVDSITFR